MGPPYSEDHSGPIVINFKPSGPGDHDPSMVRFTAEVDKATVGIMTAIAQGGHAPTTRSQPSRQLGELDEETITAIVMEPVRTGLHAAGPGSRSTSVKW